MSTREAAPLQQTQRAGILTTHPSYTRPQPRETKPPLNPTPLNPTPPKSNPNPNPPKPAGRRRRAAPGWAWVRRPRTPPP